MKVALQYCPTQGLAPLIDWLKELQRQIHSPPLWKNGLSTELDLIVTSGSQDGLCKVLGLRRLQLGVDSLSGLKLQ